MKGAIITIGIICLIAASLVVGFLVWSITQPCTQPASQQQVISGEEIDTSDWLTYRNEEYGFEFKYPVYLFKISSRGDDRISFSTNNIGAPLEMMPEDFWLAVKILFVDDNNDLSTYIKKDLSYGTLLHEEHIEHDGKFVLINKIDSTGRDYEGGHSYNAYIEFNDYVIKFDLFSFENSTIEKNSNIFKEIIQTLDI
ncbi:hypothetical protein KKA15_02090 [Patescibacteria group bacterium]|nr:hypothetical protein [Patescibacteria group bacterium]